MPSNHRGLELVAGVLFFLSLSGIWTAGAQELGHVNKSHGIDFEKEGIFAEILPGGGAMSTETTVPKTSEGGSAYGSKTAPQTTASSTASAGVGANHKATKSLTEAPWREPAVAKVVEPREKTSAETTEDRAETAEDGAQTADGKSESGDRSSETDDKGTETTDGKVIMASTASGATKLNEISSTGDLKENIPAYITYPSVTGRVIFRQKQDAHITCTAQGNPRPQFRWYKNGLPVPTSGEWVRAFSNGTLSFTKFSSREDGLYQCEARNAHGTALSVNVPIVGAVASVGSGREMQPVKAKKWDKIKLVCGDVSPTIPEWLWKWYRGESSSEVFGSSRVGINSRGDLYFAYVELGDSNKVYQCGRAPPKAGGSSVITFVNKRSFSVEDSDETGDFAPNAEFYTTNAKAVIGQPFELECFFSGRPVPSIRWKNSSNHDIRAGDPRYEIQDFGRKLLLRAVRQEDEGQFKCTADNRLASKEQIIPLNVTTAPMRTSEGSLGTHTSPDQQSFTLTCMARVADGELMDTPKWYRNGERLRSENVPDPARYQFNDAMTELTIERLDREVDTASYQCNVSNSEGYLFMNGYLRVIYSIEVTQQPPEVIEVSRNDSGVYDITVLARGDSCCRIDRLYYFNDSQLPEETLAQPPFRRNLTDGSFSFVPSSVPREILAAWIGTYRCRVSNPHQDVDVYFQVIYKEEPVPIVAKSDSFSLWWVLLLCGLLAVLIAAIVGFIVYKNKNPGDTYQLEKTELKHNLNPEEDLLNQSFQDI